MHSNLTECATDGTLLCSRQLSGALIKNYLGWHLFEMPTRVGLTAMQSCGGQGMYRRGPSTCLEINIETIADVQHRDR